MWLIRRRLWCMFLMILWIIKADISVNDKDETQHGEPNPPLRMCHCKTAMAVAPHTLAAFSSTRWWKSWWRHQMETFSALLAICAGNSPVSGEFATQMPVTRSFDIFFDLRLNKLLGKQSWGWWFETLSYPLWRQGNDLSGQKHLIKWITGTYDLCMCNTWH